jgi:mono/diheme cytochrome c family protein
MSDPRRFLSRVAVAAAVVGVASTAAWALPWDIDMFDAQSVKAYEEPMRPLPAGVVSQANITSPKSFVENYDRVTPQGQALLSPFDATPETLARGERMYGVYCTPCHGDGVTLGPVAAPGRVPAVAVLAGPNGVLKNRTDGWVYLTIRNGSAIMPPYGYAMTDTEMWSVVHYVRTLPGAAHVPAAPPAPEIPR